MTPEQYQAFLKTQRAMSQVSVDQQTLQAVLPTGGQAKVPDQAGFASPAFMPRPSEQERARPRSALRWRRPNRKLESRLAASGALSSEDPSEARQAGRYRMTAEADRLLAPAASCWSCLRIVFQWGGTRYLPHCAGGRHCLFH